jgi:C_GCAxxG_C_C family probable redox protein
MSIDDFYTTTFSLEKHRMDDHAQTAHEYMKDYNCSQSVLLSFAEELGLSFDTAARLASGFGGGMGRNGQVCGAVSGALMTLGLKYGSPVPGDKVAKENTYALISQFIDAFRKEHGGVTCSELLGLSLGNPEEAKQARELGLFQNRCPLFVQGSVRILTEMMK